jgi:hypothetical protein
MVGCRLKNSRPIFPMRSEQEAVFKAIDLDGKVIWIMMNGMNSKLLTG